MMGSQRGRAGIVISAVSAAALALAGCAADTALLAGATTDNVRQDGASLSVASTDKAAFNPFSTDPETAVGAREVIEAPTLADVLARASDLPEMSYGRADAPVVLVKYMSLSCPYCRRFHAEVFPGLKRDYIDTGKVRFVLREFPIGKASGTATIALRCAASTPEAYLALYGRFLAQQAQWVSQEVRIDAIGRVAAHEGLTAEAFSACLADKGLAARLNAVKERGRKLGIIGTPNFFLDNRLIKTTVDGPKLRSLLDARLAGGRAE
jgi:protein-disulfide isomerase